MLGAMEIRLLGAGDEHLLARLALDDAAFDLAGRGRPRTPLDADAAAAYLADAHVLHWVAEDDRVVVGHLLCHVQRRRSGRARELLLYEIGVRDGHRRRGVGRALVGAMETWMRAHAVEDLWVLADNDGAVAFYEACGFVRDDAQPTQMSRTL